MNDFSKITELMIAEYLIESFSSMYEDGYYYVHWNPEIGLNYNGNDDPENITVCAKCDYAQGLDRCKFDSKESYDDPDFMTICEKLADLLNEKIQTERWVDNG